MKNKIISLFLSVVIFTTAIIQPIVVRANPVVYVGGGLFALLMTALAHAGYTVEDQSSADYIYNFFFKKWLSDEDLKEIGLEGQSNAKEFWDGIAEKLTTPLDSSYPSLKGVFDYKVTSAGAKIVANCTPALKQAIDQLVKDLPDDTLVDLGTMTSVIDSPIQSFPFKVENCYFPTLSLPEEGYITRTSPYVRIHVSINNPSDSGYVKLKLDTKYNDNKYSYELGSVRSVGVEPNATCIEISNFNNYRPNFDNVSIKTDVSTTGFVGYSIPRNCDHTYDFYIEETYNCTVTGLEIVDSLWEIPFNEGSKALYRDNEAIWEQMGSIEAKLDDVISQPLTDSYPQSIGMTFPLTQEVADSYVQEKDEIDIKSKDEVKEEETQTPVVPEIPIDGITDNSSKLTDKFPFCIPFDLVRSVQSFKDTSNTKIEFDVPIPYSNDPLHFCLDFQKFEVVVIIFRFFSLLIFIISMLTLTRNIIRG